jgi:hypothetical protein
MANKDGEDLHCVVRRCVVFPQSSSHHWSLADTLLNRRFESLTFVTENPETR